MKNIWLDGIMGVVVGDALGLPVQFLSREEIEKNPVTEMRGYGAFDVPPGSWSDDSSLTLATLDSLRKREKIDYVDIMERFADWMENGAYTPFGYAYDIGRTCLKAIGTYMFKRSIKNCGQTGERSNGNGALMRIMPICLYCYEEVKNEKMSIEDAVANIHEVSALTHNHLRSKMACGIYFFMVRAILDEEGTLVERIQKGMHEAEKFYKADVLNWLEWANYSRMENLEQFAQLSAEDIKSTGYVVDSLEAAVWSLITTGSLEEGLLKAVNLGEDTDTIGAIAGGLAGLYYGYSSIPKEWTNTIIKGEEIAALCELVEEKY